MSHQPLWHPSISVVAAVAWRAPAIKPRSEWNDSTHEDNARVESDVARAIDLEARQLSPRATPSNPLDKSLMVL